MALSSRPAAWVVCFAFAAVPGAAACACVAGLVPAILVHSAENTAGLATRAALPDQVVQYVFGLVSAAKAVEGEPDLLLDHDGLGERPGHLTGQIDHGLPCAHCPKREKEVDHHCRVGVGEGLEGCLQESKRFQAFATRGRDLRFNSSEYRTRSRKTSVLVWASPG